MTSLGCCPICFGVSSRNKELETGGGNGEDLEGRFFQLLGRYLEEANNMRPLSPPVLEQIRGMVSCGECFKVMEEFCELFHQLKKIEIRLNWKVERLKSLLEMEGVDGFREWIWISRRSGRKKGGQDCSNNVDGLIELVIDWKESLKTKCSQKLKESVPKICIKKWQQSPNPNLESNKKTMEGRSTEVPTAADDHGHIDHHHHDDYHSDDNYAEDDSGPLSQHLKIVKTSSLVAYGATAAVISSKDVDVAQVVLPPTPTDNPTGNDMEMDWSRESKSKRKISSVSEPASDFGYEVVLFEPLSMDSEDTVDSFHPLVDFELKQELEYPNQIISSEAGTKPIPSDAAAGQGTFSIQPQQQSLESFNSGKKLSLRATHRCPKCSRTFSSFEKLQSHQVQDHHHHHENYSNDANTNTALETEAGSNGDSDSDSSMSCLMTSDDPDGHDLNLDSKTNKKRKIAKVKQKRRTNPSRVLKGPLHYKNKDATPFRLKCPDCSILFQNVRKLLLHWKESKTCAAGGSSTSTEDALTSRKVEVLITPNDGGNGSDFTIVNAVIDLPREIFICDICSLAVYSREDFQAHQKLHRRFHCSFCKFTANYAPTLATHELLHSQKQLKKGNRICCPRCEFNCAEGFNMNYVLHFVKSHLSLTLNQPCCPICKTNKMELEDSSLGDHFKIQHDLTTNQKFERCKVESCTAYFLTPVQLTNHMRFRHPQTVESGNFRLKCPDCLAPFRDAEALLLHRKASESSYDPFKSITVDVLIPPPEAATLENLDDSHFTSVSAVIDLPQAVFSCDLCNLTVYSTEDFQAHQKLHGKFPCNSCPFQADYAPKLSLHELEHCQKLGKGGFKSGSQFQCSRCPFKGQHDRPSKSMKYVQHHLNEHLSLNLNEPLCPICKTNSVHLRKSGLRLHFKSFHDMRNASPEDILKCTVANCEAYFLNACYLGQHLKWRHNICEPFQDGADEIGPSAANHGKELKTALKHKCKDCDDKSFTTGHQLRAHRLKHHVPSGQTIPCKFQKCPKQFATKRELERHLKYRDSAKFHQSLEDPNFSAQEKVPVQCRAPLVESL